jgi:tetratricopeptide (TPR) repeat protein
MHEESIKLAQQIIEIHGDHLNRQVVVGLAYAASGEKEKAQNLLHEIIKMSDRRIASSTWISMLYAGLGLFDKAVEWAIKAREEHDPQLYNLNSPFYDSLLSDSRFNELVKKIGFEKLYATLE